MKNNSKKWIALLAVACLATSAAALAGCKDDAPAAKTEIETVYDLYVAHAQASGSDVMTYEEWLATIKGADGKDGENGKDGADAHVHTYDENAEPVVLVAPTGAGAGLGYITCNAEDCGHIEMKVLEKVAGILPSNPIELTVGEEETVAINTYDDEQFGANVLMGQKGVAYFKFDVEGVNLLSIEDGDANAKYTFYSDENYEYASGRLTYEAYDDDWNVIPSTAYLKVEYSNFAENPSATIKVNARKVENAEVKYNLQLENYDENPTGTVTAFNENGEKELIEFEGFGDDGKGFVMLDATKSWKLQVSVDDGHYVYDGGTINVDFPVDGSMDDGNAESVITVAKQYVYKFNVADQAGAKVLYDAVVTVADEGFNTLASAKTNHLGVATIRLKETKNDEGNFVAPAGYASVSGFGVVNSAALELTPTAETQELVAGFTLTNEENNFEFDVEVDHTVGAWTVDGAANEVNPYAAIAGGIVNLAEAGEYTLAVNGKGLQGNFIVSVDGKDVASFAATDKVIISLEKGESKVGVRSAMNPSVGVVGVTISPVPAIVQVELVDNKVTVSPEVQYVYTVKEAGDYTFAIPAEYANLGDVVFYASKADGSKNGFTGENALLDGYQFSGTPNKPEVVISGLEVDDTISFYMCASFYSAGVTLADVEVTIKKAEIVATEVELDTAITLEQGTYYSFTAKKTGTYYFTCANPLDQTYANWVGLGTSNTWDGYAADNFYNSIDQKYGAIKVEAGETYVFCASLILGDGTLYIVTERPDDYVAPETPDEGGDDETGGFDPKA